MLSLLWKILVGSFRPSCQHKWETMESREVYEDDDSTRPYAHKRFCRCEHCGAWKKFKL